jgi:hypothetical protein
MTSFVEPFGTKHVRRLNRLARFVERSRSFNMNEFFNDCGTAACLAGHGLVLFERHLPNGKHTDPWVLAEFLTGSADQCAVYNVLFNSVYGAGGAGRSGKKAAKYIREVFIPSMKKGAPPLVRTP